MEAKRGVTRAMKYMTALSQNSSTTVQNSLVISHAATIYESVIESPVAECLKMRTCMDAGQCLTVPGFLVAHFSTTAAADVLDAPIVV